MHEHVHIFFEMRLIRILLQYKYFWKMLKLIISLPTNQKFKNTDLGEGKKIDL